MPHACPAQAPAWRCLLFARRLPGLGCEGTLPSPFVMMGRALLLLSLALDGAAALALDGQRVVVTGGGRGIGKALALLCAEEGAHVAILARTQLELESVLKEAATRGVPTPLRMRTADVTDEASVDAAVLTITRARART